MKNSDLHMNETDVLSVEWAPPPGTTSGFRANGGLRNPGAAPVLGVFLCLLLVTGCSSRSNDDDPSDGIGTSDDADNPLPDGASTAGDGNEQTGGGDVPQEPGQPPATLDASNFRAWAIDTLEIIDVLSFHGVALVQALNDLSGNADCAEGGTVAFSDSAAAGGFQASLAECVLKVDWPSVSGTVSLDGDGHLSLEEVRSVDNASRTTRVSGQLTLSTQDNTVSLGVNNTGLILNEGQGDIVFSTLAMQQSPADASAAVSYGLAYKARYERFAGNASVNASGTLAQQFRLNCPGAGTVQIDAGAQETLTINGEAGGNVMLSFGTRTDTLSCEELATLIGAVGGVSPPPPPPPGG